MGIPVRREMSEAVRLDASGPTTSKTRVAWLSVVSPLFTVVTSPSCRAVVSARRTLLGRRLRSAVAQRVPGGHTVGVAVERGEPAAAVEAPAGSYGGHRVAAGGVGGEQVMMGP